MEKIDFARARNYSKDKCKGKRIFIIDGDEILATDAKEVRKTILKFDPMNTAFTTIHLQMSPQNTVMSQLQQYRIFPNAKEICYRDREHNQLTIKKDGQYIPFEHVFNTNNGKLKNTNITFKHLGHQDPKKEKARFERTKETVRLLKEEIDSHEDKEEVSFEKFYNLLKGTIYTMDEEVLKYAKMGIDVYMQKPPKEKEKFDRYLLTYIMAKTLAGEWDVEQYIKEHVKIMGVTVDNSFYNFAYNYRAGKIISAFSYARSYLELVQIEQQMNPVGMQGTLFYRDLIIQKLAGMRYFIEKRAEI